MAIVLAAVLAIYAISLGAVVTLFVSAVLRERSASTDSPGAVYDLAPSVADQSALTDQPTSAKSA